jgi:hypothetical protein
LFPRILHETDGKSGVARPTSGRLLDGFNPILSKRPHCRSPADGGVDHGGGMAVEKDELQKLGAVVGALLLGTKAATNELTSLLQLQA